MLPAVEVLSDLSSGRRPFYSFVLFRCNHTCVYFSGWVLFCCCVRANLTYFRHHDKLYG